MRCESEGGRETQIRKAERIQKKVIHVEIQRVECYNLRVCLYEMLEVRETGDEKKKRSLLHWDLVKKWNINFGNFGAKSVEKCFYRWRQKRKKVLWSRRITWSNFLASEKQTNVTQQIENVWD